MKKPRRPPQKALIYEGPFGLCPCCNRKTEVRVASTLGAPPDVVWTVPEPLLRLLYSEVAKRIKEKVQDGQPRYYTTDPSRHEATVRNKFFFVAAGDGDDNVAGPFGQNGLKVFLEGHFPSDDSQAIRVFVVTTTHRALSVIRQSPYAQAPEEKGEDYGTSTDPF